MRLSRNFCLRSSVKERIKWITAIRMEEIGKYRNHPPLDSMASATTFKI